MSGSGSAGDVAVPHGLLGGGVHGNLSLTTANTAYEAKVGASRLAKRQNLTVTALDNDMYWGYSNSVTTSTGFPLYKNQVVIFDIDPDSDTPLQVWLVCGTANKNARIAESL